MKTRYFIPVFLLVALSACTDSFKKGGNGIEYKIISDGHGKTVGYGNFIQLHFKQTYKGATDTLLGDSRDFMPRINMLDSISTPPEFFMIIKQLRIGDSLIMRTPVDSFYKKQPKAKPDFMKGSDMIYTSLKVLNIFETREQADSANSAESKIARPRIFKKQMERIETELIEKNKTQLESEVKAISEHLAKNNIKATKTKWGTFVSINNEGTGEKITSSDIVMVNYTGRTLDSGRVIDSNTDPAFKHVQPLQVIMGQLGPDLVLGWIDALFQMKKGTKATVYIPATLAYGKQGRGAEVGPNQNLVFDMEVISAENEEVMLARQEAEQKRITAQQKAMIDSMNKANSIQKK